MGIMNRRNAVLGWGVWKLGKKVAKRKAKTAVPGTGEHAGLNKSALATIAATVGGALFFWRKKSGSTTTE
jgi:ABC-type Co2+ transport system permease subunit